MSTDMATLTGAYAVNALSDAERAEFELHLAGCEDCRQEVAELREAAARLGGTQDTTPPDELKRRVMDTVARTRQDPPLPSDEPASPVVLRRQRSPWGTRLAVAAAVLGIALAAAFGAITMQTRQELADVRQNMEQAGARGAEMARVLQAPDARMTRATGPNAIQATTVVSQQAGLAMFMGSGMAAPPDDRVYQLWFIGPSGMTSAGVFRGDGSEQAEALVAPLPAGTAQMGITVEPAGGSPQPTTDPILTMPVPA